MSYRQWNVPGTALFIALMICLLPVSATGKTMPAGRLPLSAQYSVSAALGKDQQQFHVRPTPDGSQFENQSQKLIARISSSGQLVLDTRGHYLKMEPVSLDFSSTTLQRTKGVLKYSGNRISLDYGLYSEWLVNGPMGLQQGFTIKKRPEHALSHSFTLTLNVDSDLLPYLDRDEDGVSFLDKDGTTVFQYSGLMVADARNQQLPAHMEANNNQIEIVVDDRNAIYPVTVDPIFQQAKLTASDGADYDQFGYSVAVDDTTMVVGAPQHDITTNLYQGAAYVFEKTSSGWFQTAKLTASDGGAYDRFGACVAISDSVVVVGASHHDTAGHEDQGAAYIFIKPGTGWANMHENARLMASDGNKYAYLGNSVAIDQDTIVVGDSKGDASHPLDDKGAVYIFVKPVTGWADSTENAKLIASNGWPQDQFGSSVAVHQETVVVGASKADLGSAGSNRGAIYVYKKPVSGWHDMTETALLTASDGSNYDYLGQSVALFQDTIIGGADIYDTNGKIYVGAAYVYEKPATGWTSMTQTAKLTASNGMDDDHFGRSVGIDGNTIVIGSPYHNYSGIADNGMPFVTFDMGAVYTFTRPSGGWHDMSAKAEMISSDGHADDHLGKSVAISGQTVVAGAPGQDISGRQDQGAAYVFRLKKKSSWPMFVSAITSHVGYLIAGNKAAGHPTSGSTSTYRLYIGAFSTSYTNKVIPHYSWESVSFCYIEMPVIGDVGQLICCGSNPVNYDADENDGGLRIRRKGSITFNPSGTCSKSMHSCTVEPHGTGSETYWQWYSTDNGLSWTLVPGMPVTIPINWNNNPYYFDQMDIVHGDIHQAVEMSTSTGEIKWELDLIPRP